VAERTGAQPVLGGAVVGVAIGAALMSVPGPGFVAVVGMMALGLAAAPIFPLLTLTTARRLGSSNADHAYGDPCRWLPRLLAPRRSRPASGVAIGLLSAKALAPLLFVLALAMGGAYAHISALARRSPP